MYQSRTPIVALLATMVLCLCFVSAVSIATDTQVDGSSEKVLGASYESHSPSGLYELKVQYFEGNDLELRLVKSDTGEDTTESSHAVSVTVYKLSGIDDSAHDGTHTKVASLFPFSMGSLQRVSCIMQDLPQGFYHVVIDAASGGEVVCAKFMVVEMIELTFKASDGGKVSEGSVSGTSMVVSVPKGSAVSMDGDSIVMKYQSKTFHTVTATPPSGMYLGGWYVDDSKLSSGSSLTKDCEVLAKWSYTRQDDGDGSDDDTDDDDGKGGTKASIPVTTVRIPKGMSASIPYTVKPSTAKISWSSSDESVATVQNGKVSALSEGTVTISILDQKNKTIATVVVVVEPSSGTIIQKEVESANGGNVITTYEKDGDDDRLVNPIVIKPENSEQVTPAQSSTARGYMQVLANSGIEPEVIVTTDSTRVSVPSDLLKASVDWNGSLTVIEGNVTLFYSSEVLKEMGYSDDIQFIIIPQKKDDVGDLKIDDEVLQLDPVIYEVYMLRNGERIILEDSPVTNPIEVSITYPLKSKQTPDDIRLFYLEPDPDFKMDFTYSDDALHFEVFHFCHYAIGYVGVVPADDDEDGDGNGWALWLIGIIMVLLLALFLFWLFFVKWVKVVLVVEGGAITAIPEGWERESDDSISCRFRWHAELELPHLAAVPPEGLEGHVIVGWEPEPPEKVTGSIELRCTWSEGIPEKLGDSKD